MNDIPAPLISLRSDERHPNQHEQPQLSGASRGTDISPENYRRSPNRLRTKAAIICGFWVLQYLGTTALVSAMRQDNYMGVRAIVSAIGIALSFGMAALLDRLQDRSLAFRAACAVALALTTPALHSVINQQVFEIAGVSSGASFIDYVQDYLFRLWIFSSLSAIILALSYASDIREREQRIGSLQALAHSAQLSALRNQLSPHFLFNALNSIAGLISAKRVADAETMTENLADFLRQTLALDPQQLITLDEEMQLQRLYLDIEKTRFPDRLKVVIDVPESLRSALLPSLITQPLIENSIKYAVSRSRRAVELRIAAQRVGDRLELVVRDDGGDADPAESKGARLGLRNVAERVHMHYGDRGEFLAGRDAAGEYRNILLIPLEGVE